MALVTSFLFFDSIDGVDVASFSFENYHLRAKFYRLVSIKTKVEKKYLKIFRFF
jgi:hypothetical protein